MDRAGNVAVPFGGQVRVQGLTSTQAAAAIRRYHENAAYDARVRLIGDADITDEELRDLETARGLFRQISDPGNPPSLRDTYRARLVQVLRRIDERPGSRVSFSPRALLELEGRAGGTST